MRRHFTLVELLVVAAIIAIIAGSIMVSYTGLDDSSKMTIARSDMTQLRDAFRKFRQNMYLLPKEGALKFGSVTTSFTAVSFNHPANFEQIMTRPVDALNPTLWNEAAGKTRSWQGPYCGPRVLLNPAVAADLTKLDSLNISGTAAAPAGIPASPVQVILDPWGKPYLYIVPLGTSFATAYLRSCGPDGVVNNTDDLTLDIAQ